jgi:hypothetical protein
MPGTGQHGGDKQGERQRTGERGQEKGDREGNDRGAEADSVAPQEWAEFSHRLTSLQRWRGPLRLT